MAKFDGALARANTERIGLYLQALAFQGEAIHQEMKSTPLLRALFGPMIHKTELFDGNIGSKAGREMKVLRQFQPYDVSQEETHWFIEWGISSTTAALDDTSALAVATVSTTDMLRDVAFKNHALFDRKYMSKMEDYYKMNPKTGHADTTKLDLINLSIGRGIRDYANTRILSSVGSQGGTAVAPTSGSLLSLEYLISDGLNQAARATYYGSSGLNTGDNWTGSTNDHSGYSAFGTMTRASAGNEPLRGVVRRVANNAALTDGFIRDAAQLTRDKGASNNQILWLGKSAYSTVASATRNTASVQITDEQKQMVKDYGIGTYFKVAGDDGILVARDPAINEKVGYLLDHSSMALGWTHVSSVVDEDSSRNYANFVRTVYQAQLMCKRPSVNSLILID